jgi:hypothetical protein
MKIKIVSTVPAFDPNINPTEIEVDGATVDETYDDGQILNVDAQFQDIISSGQSGFEPIGSGEWQRRALEALFGAMTSGQKIALFVYAIENMPESEGWFLGDIDYLQTLCGIESFQGTLS